MREQIREELGDKLKEFGERFPALNDDTTPDFIASGSRHTHYALGKVGDIWLATRENCLISEDSKYCLADAEEYVARQLEHQSQLPSDESPLAIVGGVCVGSWPRYFLIVEDLSQGNTKTIWSSGIGSDCIRVDDRIVRVDFYEPLGLTKYPAPQYLAPENMIVIDSDF